MLKIISVAISSLIFFILLSSFLGFWTAVRPPQIDFGYSPDDFDLPAEDVRLTSFDGTVLAAWFIPASDPTSDQAIILLHGYPTSKSDMLNIAHSLHPDFNLLLLDLRYFGDSGGFFTTIGLKEKKDISAAVDWLQNRGLSSISAFGFSLGGATAIMAAANDSRLQSVITYAPFSDLRSLGYEIYRPFWILKYPLVEMINIWSRLFLGDWLASSSPAASAANLNIPVLLIHSEDDEQISFANALRLQKSLSENPHADFLFLSGYLHGHLPPDFSQTLINFWQSAL